jgi:hypothetical protein
MHKQLEQAMDFARFAIAPANEASSRELRIVVFDCALLSQQSGLEEMP